MNKFKIVLYVFLCSVLLSACYHEDDIIPSEKTMVLRFDFPQGNNSWDEDLIKINEEFGVCMIYKDRRRRLQSFMDWGRSVCSRVSRARFE